MGHVGITWRTHLVSTDLGIKQNRGAFSDKLIMPGPFRENFFWQYYNQVSEYAPIKVNTER